MPLTQNAPREPGCSGFGAILVTLPSTIVSKEPQSAEHSQQVLGTISVADRFEGRTFIAISSRVRRLYACNTSASGTWHIQRLESRGCTGSITMMSPVGEFRGGGALLTAVPAHQEF